MIARAGSGVEPGAPVPKATPQAAGQPVDNDALCYIVIPKRVRFGDAMQWAAHYQKRFCTAIELVGSDNQVLHRFDNGDREDRYAPHVLLSFPWHPNWIPTSPEPAAPKPKPITDENKPVRPGGVHHRKGTGPAGRVLELCLRDEGASPAELREIGKYCDGMTYLQRLENVHGLTLEKLPNGNFKFSRKESEA